MTPHEYLEHVRRTARTAADYLPAEPLEEVHRLIEHGEPAEGLCSLAWAIVNIRATVPLSVIREIREYTRGVIDEEFLPSNLGAFAADTER